MVRSTGLNHRNDPPLQLLRNCGSLVVLRQAAALLCAGALIFIAVAPANVGWSDALCTL